MAFVPFANNSNNNDNNDNSNNNNNNNNNNSNNNNSNNNNNNNNKLINYLRFKTLFFSSTRYFMSNSSHTYQASI